MITEDRRREIVAAFQRSFKSNNTGQHERFTLEELIAADEMIGSRDLNEAYRLRLRNRIQFLSAARESEKISKTRWTDRILGIAVGVLLTILGGWLAK